MRTPIFRIAVLCTAFVFLQLDSSASAFSPDNHTKTICPIIYDKVSRVQIGYRHEIPDIDEDALEKNFIRILRSPPEKHGIDNNNTKLKRRLMIAT